MFSGNKYPVPRYRSLAIFFNSIQFGQSVAGDTWVEMNVANISTFLSCVFGLIVHQAASAENQTESCASWPTDLKTLTECCVIPYHSDYHAEELCQRDCYVKQDYKGGAMKCILDCYVGKGTRLIRNGKISKTTVVDLYGRECYSKECSDHWKKIVAAGVKSCIFESNGT